MSEECKCGTQFCKHHKAQVWSCGGGTQSCAIAALIVQGKLPKPDFSVIADTEREASTTWSYADSILTPELKKVGVDLVRVSKQEFATVDMWSLNGDWCSIPCFSNIDGGASKCPNYCTNEWKTRVIERWLKTQGVNRGCYVKWIGFSVDETARVLRMQKAQENVRFPLVEQRLNRRECIAFVQSSGWPMPPRSRCWMCPNQSDTEWKELKEQMPLEFEKAVQLEREIQELDPFLWLHKSCVPIDLADFSQPDDLFSRACHSGECFR